HQDAINKGFASIERDAAAAGVPLAEYQWEVPYLPIDPKDVGRGYEAVVRVNSQSGKGGVAYIMKSEHHLELPRRLQMEFSGVVQAYTDAEGGEVTPDQMWAAFQSEYLTREAPLRLNSVHTSAAEGRRDALRVAVYHDGERRELDGEGNGPIAAFCDALSKVDLDVRVLDYSEHALSAGGDATAAAYVECAVGGSVVWGVGLDANIVTASLKAVVSAVNRAIPAR
ncbi:MAG: alpha-isopropylmalate synthase regulatory domain-containing protein, partial [Actinomycetales bacterium]